MKKRICGVIAVLLVCVGIGIRIWYVNATAFSIPVETYKMGEWVNLDGCFFETINENTKGYSVKIVQVQRMSFQEYLEKYNLAEDEDLGYKTPPEFILDVTLEFKADENADGGIALMHYRISSANNAVSYNVEPTLTGLTVPLLANTYVLSFAIRPGTAYTVSFPFVLGSYPSGEWQEDDGESHRYLTVSSVPVEKRIEIDF